MASWTNATPPGGGRRTDLTAERADLRVDYPISAEMEPFVEGYWSIRWQPLGGPYRTEVPIRAGVVLSVQDGDRPRHGFGLPAALLHGVATRRYEIDLFGWGRCTAVTFRPGGWTAYTGGASPLNSITMHSCQGLVRGVLASDDDAERVAVLDRALGQRAPSPSPEYLQLSGIVTRIATTPEVTHVGQVARWAGMSRRDLHRLFTRLAGVTPEWTIAYHRLQDAAAAFATGVEDVPALALRLGWTDVAVFEREFRAARGVGTATTIATARERATPA